MGSDQIRGFSSKVELPNVAGLLKLIDDVKEFDLTFLPGEDKKIQQLKKQIEGVTASEDDKRRLRSLFDVKLCDLTIGSVGLLLSEGMLRQKGLGEEILMHVKRQARKIMTGLENLPIFDEDNRTMLAHAVRSSLEEKKLIGPSEHVE